MLFFPSYKPPFFTGFGICSHVFSIVSNVFPLQRWDVPAGKQPGPAELYPEVELAPWWRYSMVAKGREGFGKKQILWIYISIPMVVYKYCIKYRVTHMYIYIYNYIYTYTYSCIIYIYNMRSYRHPMQIKGCNNLHWCSYPSCHGPSKAHSSHMGTAEPFKISRWLFDTDGDEVEWDNTATYKLNGWSWY